MHSIFRLQKTKSLASFVNGPLVESKIAAGDVSTKAAGNNHTNEYHDLLPPRLGLVLKRLLGVVGGPGCVLHRALYVSVDPAAVSLLYSLFLFMLFIQVMLNLLTISPWFSTNTEMSMNIS